MSEVKVNKVTPRSGTTLTIGDSGDTTNVVGTLQNNGAALVGDISSVVAGTNLSGGGTSGAVTINLADASTSAKGASSFSSDNFAASSGAITIKTGGVATAELQEDAVTLAKMAPGTDGNIISYDGSGNPVAIATGSDGQVLTSAGTGAQPAFETLNVTPAANSITTSQLAYNPNAFRNILINGDMGIAQRATSLTGITGSGYHTIDRFNTVNATLGTWTQSQSTDVPTGQGFATSLKMDCTTADASPAAGDQLRIQQLIEGQNLQYLKKGTSSAESLTLSFWVKSNKTGTYIAELFDNDNNRTVSKSYTISNSNTWEKKTITFPVDTSAAFGNDNATSLLCNLWLGGGSNFTSGTLQTSWGSRTNANRAVGQVNLGDSTSNDWYVTGVQLEAGTSASDFEFLPVDVNTTRCLRYYQKTFEYGQAPVDNAQKFEYHFIEPYGGTSISGLISYYSVEMRATPTVTVYTTGQSANGTGKITFYNPSVGWGNATAAVDGSSTTKCVHFSSAFSGAKLAQFNYEASSEL